MKVCFIARIREMSSKLVRKGLELVCNDGTALSKKRKSATTHPGNKKIKRKPRGHEKQSSLKTVKALHLSGKTKKKPAIDYTEQNLRYFTNTSWRIDKDAYDKILERQKKKSRDTNKALGSQPQEEDSETEEFGAEA